jgi:two-component system, LuxR family, sensor kinase FixL
MTAIPSGGEHNTHMVDNPPNNSKQSRQPRSRRKRGSRIARLVGALILIGLSACIVTALFAWRTLAVVQAERARVEKKQATLAAAMTHIQWERESVRGEIEEIRHADGDSSILESYLFLSSTFDKTVRRCRLRLSAMDTSDPELVDTLDKHRGAFARLDESGTKLGDHLRRSYRLVAKRSEAVAAFRQLVRETIVAADRTEGRQRLHWSVFVRKFHRATEEDRSSIATDIIAMVAAGQSVNAMTDELNELALLVEHLLSVEDEDTLVSLRENRILQSMSRLSREAKNVDGKLDQDFSVLVTRIQQGLFGHKSLGEAQPQIPLSDENGIYTLQRELLASRSEKHVVDAELADAFARCMQTERRVNEAIQNLDAAVAEQDAKSLLTAWRNSFLTAGLMAIVFCVLGVGAASIGRRAEFDLQENASKLAEQQRRTEAIMQGMSDAVVTINESGIIEEFNGAAEQTFGYAAEEIIGQSVNLLMPLPHSDQHDEYLARYLRTGDARVVGIRREVEALRKDGTTFPAMLSVSQITLDATNDDDSTRFLFSGIVRDLTEEKKAETELSKTHRELLNVSRMAGMSEIATGVLHNVGNVLNSVNVSASLVTDKVRNTNAADLKQVGDLVAEHATDMSTFVTEHPQGQHLADYLIALGNNAISEQEAMLEDLLRLETNIEHIREIVSMQQSCTRIAGATELLSPQELIEDALRMGEASFISHGIEVVRDYVDPPLITADRHKTLQILVNLVNNAKRAISDHRSEGGRLLIRIFQTEGNHIRFEVTDNGIGIAKENMAKVFNYGFTTKKDGHGFGLHSSALAAKEMNGELVVQSDGRGTGATFSLELPMEDAMVAATTPV